MEHRLRSRNAHPGPQPCDRTGSAIAKEGGDPEAGGALTSLRRRRERERGRQAGRARAGCRLAGARCCEGEAHDVMARRGGGANRPPGPPGPPKHEERPPGPPGPGSEVGGGSETSPDQAPLGVALGDQLEPQEGWRVRACHSQAGRGCSSVGENGRKIRVMHDPQLGGPVEVRTCGVLRAGYMRREGGGGPIAIDRRSGGRVALRCGRVPALSARGRGGAQGGEWIDRLGQRAAEPVAIPIPIPPRQPTAPFGHTASILPSLSHILLHRSPRPYSPPTY